jgi:hypothetical protein
MNSVQALLIEILRNPLVELPIKLRAGFLLSRLSKAQRDSGSLGSIF